MPTISVVIPVYNGEKTLAETVQSVLDQTFVDFELIIINDGSQDKTLELIAKFSDDRIKVFSYENAGLAASRNRGMHQASGELITFLDADDLWTKDKLAAQLQALQTHPQAAVAYSWTDYINEAGQFLYPGTHTTANGKVLEKLLIKNFIENGSNALIRRTALQTVGEFDVSLPAAEDWDMWLRLAAQFEFVAVPAVQILYRISTTSMSANLDRQEKACLTVIERATAQAPDALRSLKRRSTANLYQYLLFKSLEGRITRQKSLTAARCLYFALTNDPAMLKRQTRLMTIVSIKIAAGVLLPGTLAERLLKTMKR